jgi:hypothetical protein
MAGKLKIWNAGDGVWQYVSHGAKGDTGIGNTGVTGATGVLNPISINTQTDSYVLALSDASKLVEIDKGTAVNLTVPANGDIGFVTGTRIAVRQKGAGQLTFVGGTGVSINAQGSATKLSGQYAMAMLVKLDTNVWELEGNVTA